MLDLRRGTDDRAAITDVRDVGDRRRADQAQEKGVKIFASCAARVDTSRFV